MGMLICMRHFGRTGEAITAEVRKRYRWLIAIEVVGCEAVFGSYWRRFDRFRRHCHGYQAWRWPRRLVRLRHDANGCDSRTLRSTPESGSRARYDGAKRKRGSKLHMAVDTLGHLLAVHVNPEYRVAANDPMFTVARALALP